MTNQVSGNLVDLDGALRDLLQRYVPSGEGLTKITGCIIALSVPAWAEASVYDSGSVASIGAGSGAVQVFYTVPQDRRVWLDGVRFDRASGDNTVNRIGVIQPEGYTNDATDMALIQYSTAPDNGFWPDPGIQANIQVVAGSPLLLEPGATIQLNPSGAGASATVFRFYLQYRLMRIVRQFAPGFVV